MFKHLLLAVDGFRFAQGAARYGIGLVRYDFEVRS